MKKKLIIGVLGLALISGICVSLVLALNSDSSSSGADTNVEDTNVADTNVEDTNVEDTNVEDTNVEDTNVADTNVEDTDVDDTNVEGYDGLSSDYWAAHTDEWLPCTTPDQRLESIFDLPDSLGLDEWSVMEALEFVGDDQTDDVVVAAKTLLREAVAAYMNSGENTQEDPLVQYYIGTGTVRSKTNTALESLDASVMLSLASEFEQNNNLTIWE